MKSRVSSTHVIAALLFIVACLLGAWGQMKQVPKVKVPRARFDDKTPLGGKGLRLMLERLGYTVKRTDGVLASMPADARVWLLLDPQAGFSKREADDLLKWVKDGGTLIWAATPTTSLGMDIVEGNRNPGTSRLHQVLKVTYPSKTTGGIPAFSKQDEPLPDLTAFGQDSLNATNEYFTGVKSIGGSSEGFLVGIPCLELVSTPFDVSLAMIPYGKGHVFIAPDALLFTNYALAARDNAVLVTNLIRVHVPSGTVYFDERSHGENLEEKITPNLLYYLLRPPLRYALLQLLVAALLLWAYFGRRLGTPVPLPDGGPVTRASQFAAAMGALFQKANRPRAAVLVIGENFRRELTRRIGLSVADPDELIAARGAEVTGYSPRVIDRLLLQAKSPDEDEARALSDAQEMETILRSFEKR